MPRLTIKDSLNLLYHWFENEHSGCDQNTCSITAAWDHDCQFMAIRDLARASFEMEKPEQDAMAYLENTKYFQKELLKEQKQFNTIPTAECSCNATIYYPDGSCDSCGGGE